MKREIILGYDPEHGGHGCSAAGTVFAEVLGSNPRVVTAVPWPHYLVGMVDVEQVMATEMEEPFGRLRPSCTIWAWRPKRSPAAPRPWPSRIADRDGAKVIVVGSCHHGPVGRTLAGSVGESLLHGASCSVAIAPHGYGERDQDRLQRIAVAFDGSSESWAALETAIGLAERCHATITAIAVADYPKLWVRDGRDDPHHWRVRDAERADKQCVLDLATSRIPAGLEHESRVLTGEPARELGMSAVSST